MSFMLDSELLILFSVKWCLACVAQCYLEDCLSDLSWRNFFFFPNPAVAVDLFSISGN